MRTLVGLIILFCLFLIARPLWDEARKPTTREAAQPTIIIVVKTKDINQKVHSLKELEEFIQKHPGGVGNPYLVFEIPLRAGSNSK